MLIKLFSTLILAVAASVALSLDASAGSRFTVQNDTGKDVFVSIFSGADQFCALEQKSRRIEAGETETHGCTGNGTQRCRLKFSAAGKQICKKQNNTCPLDSARKMRNGEKVVISKDEEDEFVCAFF
ncbi:MAG: hypothetical protein HRT80_10415 [Henriciella sp.]|nr:hypothetical protein [Henriciella sp.]